MLQFLADASDMDINNSLITVKVVSPDFLQELFAAQDHLRVTGKGFQQIKFERR